MQLPKRYNIITAIITALFIHTSTNLQATCTTTAFPIPDSGQTICYDMEKRILCPEPGEKFYGQDANYLINPPSYTKMDENGNDLPDDAEKWVMVQDNVTGLIWEVKTNDYSIHDKDNKYTWYDSNPDTNGAYAGTPGDGTDTEDFIIALNAEEFGGYLDWRMPYIYELASIANLGRYNPSIDKKFFPYAMSAFYWSSTSNANYTDCAWGVKFNYGFDFNNSKLSSSSFYVRAVRGGQCRSFDHLVINGDETVTDVNTGLMWQRETFDVKKNWKTALSNCRMINHAPIPKTCDTGGASGPPP
ncbi:secreted protein containing DUF1566 [Candidatus Magnetomorum sp. HK-1]|nr:secreted protein containing DUF1566 [Candidatus Magnetomorum sp. HK-1]